MAEQRRRYVRPPEKDLIDPDRAYHDPKLRLWFSVADLIRVLHASRAHLGALRFHRCPCGREYRIVDEPPGDDLATDTVLIYAVDRHPLPPRPTKEPKR